LALPFLNVAGKAAKVDSLIKVVESNVHDSVKLIAIDKLCGLLLGNQPDQLLKYAAKGIEIAERTNNRKKIALFYGTVGTNFKNLGQLDTAEKCQFYANGIYKELKDPKGISRTLNNLGIIEKQRAHYSKALDYYFKALSNLDKEKHKFDYAQAYTNIGIVFKHLSNYNKSKEYLDMALQIYVQLKDTSKMGSILTNLGSVYKSQKDYKKAKECLTLALDYNLKKGGDLQNLSTIYTNLGGLSSVEKDYKQAVFYYDKAIEIGIKQNNNGLIGVCYCNKAQAYVALKDAPKAKECLDKAFEMLKDLKEPRILLDYYDTYARYHVLVKDYKSAYSFVRKLKKLNDSIFSSDLTSQLAKMEKELTSAEKQKEIEILKKNQTIRESELKRQKLITGGLSVFAIVIVVLSFFIYKSFREKKKANVLLERKNSEIASQNEIIEEKNKDIIDSIKYAERLQKTILTPVKVINEIAPNSFVFFKPKDIVSGDFYWIERVTSGTLFAVIDCTGHGVPGAMMSIVGNNLLNKIVKEKGITQPGKILNEMLSELFLALRQDSDEVKANDGMDLTLCHYDPKTHLLTYAGAFNPVLIARKGEILELKTDKFSIGKHSYEHKFVYKEETFQLEKNDMVYLSTDGYPDQFGGAKGKKMMRKNFNEVLKNIAHLDKDQQAKKIEEHFYNWKGAYEQLDDITVFGSRV
jgi:serine phosphatase RsbU (regulator of sigma subunit)/Tfp pilus assembly protein PilF